MKQAVVILISISVMQFSSGQDHHTNASKDLFDLENLIAWCIVPFDGAERTPVKRAEMLHELGISQLAYDYRDQHIPSFQQEIEVLNAYRIGLRAVWFWIDPDGDEVFNASNKAILKILEETGTHTELWVSYPAHVFEDLPVGKRPGRAVEILTELDSWAQKNGCGIALYNHGDWFGEPENQIRIIESIDSERIKIVYNFHHGHEQVERFEELLYKMLPYLSAININGMKVGGPMILPLGEGDRELEMLKSIVKSGYQGPIGILGHTEGEDIKPVLERNLRGLKKLTSKL